MKVYSFQSTADPALKGYVEDDVNLPPHLGPWVKIGETEILPDADSGILRTIIEDGVALIRITIMDAPTRKHGQ